MKKEKGRRMRGKVLAVIFMGIMISVSSEPKASRGEDRGPVLCYEELEDLVKEYCPQVEMERRQFEERLGRLEDAREELLESRRILREEASDREKDKDTAGAEHYRRQAEALLDAADSLKDQIRQAGNAAGRMELRRMEDTMIWTAQNLMGTYHSLEAEQSAAGARAEAQKYLSEKTQDQQILGISTSYSSQEAYQKWQSSVNEYERLAKEKERIRRSLLLLTGFSADSPVLLEALPQPDLSKAALMDPQADSRRWEIIMSCAADGWEMQEAIRSFIKSRDRQNWMKTRCSPPLRLLGIRFVFVSQNGRQPVRRNSRKKHCGSLL